MSTSNAELPLSELPAGAEATIRSLVDNELSLKLLEMGCLPGESLRVLGFAPAGDPMAISISGYILSLRLDEAASIIVEK